MYRSKDNMFRRTHRKAFSLLELVAALTILAIITSSVMAVMSQCIESTIDHRNRAQAFRIARDNMENLLTLPSVEESVDFGEYELNPDIQWETIIEIVDHPLDSKMWVQAVCSASYTDNTGERQSIELTHWLTDLTAAQQRQILDQKKRQKDFMDEFDENPFGDDAEGLMKYANALAASGEYERAAEISREIIEEYPESPEAEQADARGPEWEKEAINLDNEITQDGSDEEETYNIFDYYTFSELVNMSDAERDAAFKGPPKGRSKL